MTAREFAEYWVSRGFPRNVMNPITGQTERAAFVTLYTGPEESDDDPEEEDDAPPLAAE